MFSLQNARTRKILFALVLALVVYGVGSAFSSRSASQKKEDGKISVTQIQKGDIEDLVTAQGKLEPKEYVDVGAQVSGQLKTIHVEIGDVVKKGDLIASIDPQIYESRKQANEARLKTLNAQLVEQGARVTQSLQKFERNKKLHDANAVSQEIFQDSETAYKVATAQRAALKAQIEEAQSTLDGDNVNLGYTKIYAPIDGTIVLQDVHEGQTLNTTQSAPTVVQVAVLDTMTVRAQVAEADVMRLKVDMPVSFTTLGSKEKKWEGKIRQILPSPETINDVVLYNVLVDVDNTDRKLMTGMSTQMFFILGAAKDVPLIPVAALGKRLPDQDTTDGRAYQVRVMSGKEQTDKTVIVGLMERSVAQVISGVAEGETVVLLNPQLGGSRNKEPAPRIPGGARL